MPGVIKSILMGLTAFDWISPTIEIARTVVTGDRHIWIADEDMVQAETILQKFGGYIRDFDFYNGGWVFSVPDKNYGTALSALAGANIGIVA